MLKTWLIFIAFMLLISSISWFITSSNPTPVGWDFNHGHIEAIREFINGDFSTFWEYPPLIRLMITPLIIANEDVRYLQVIFATLAFGSILYFVLRTWNLKTMLLTGIILLSSASYLQFSFMIGPTSTDFIVFPIVLLLYRSKHYLATSVGLLFLFYSHGLGILYYSIIMFYDILSKRKYLKYGLAVLVLSIPAILLYVIPFATFVGSTSITPIDNFSRGMYPADRAAVYPLEKFIGYSGILIWLMLPLTLWSMRRLRSYDSRDLMLVTWFISTLIFMPFTFYRWTSFMTIPVCIFEAVTIVKLLRSLNTNYIATRV